MLFLVAFAIGLTLVVTALIATNDRWATAPTGVGSRPGAKGPSWRAAGQVFSSERVSARRLGLDCLVSESPSSSPVGVPVYASVTGPVLGWPGLSLLDVAVDWCMDAEHIGIELILSGAGGAQAKLTRGTGMVLLDVDNLSQIRSVLGDAWVHQHQF